MLFRHCIKSLSVTRIRGNGPDPKYIAFDGFSNCEERWEADTTGSSRLVSLAKFMDGVSFDEVFKPSAPVRSGMKELQESFTCSSLPTKSGYDDGIKISGARRCSRCFEMNRLSCG